MSAAVSTNRLIVAITGASGVIYGARLLQEIARRQQPNP